MGKRRQSKSRQRQQSLAARKAQKAEVNAVMEGKKETRRLTSLERYLLNEKERLSTGEITKGKNRYFASPVSGRPWPSFVASFQPPINP